MRSEITIDLGALRRNVKSLLRTLDGAELWAVVKADAYGHGAVDCGGAALDAGATALCVATVPGGARRCGRSCRRRGSSSSGRRRTARSPRRATPRSSSASRAATSRKACACTSSSTRAWGAGACRSCRRSTREVVGVMTHLATADSDPDFARTQVERFREATEPVSHLTRHVANSAAALRLPESRFDAARCGIAIYGISPFGEDAARRRARAGARLADGDRAVTAAARAASRRATAGATSPSATRGSGSCRWATRTASAAT